MHLHRVTPDAFDNYGPNGKYLGQQANKFSTRTFRLEGNPPEPVIVAHFDRFGGGDKRRSDYEVLAEWRDVEAMLAKFCELGHPEALALRDARDLAKAAKSVGWLEPSGADN